MCSHLVDKLDLSAFKLGRDQAYLHALPSIEEEDDEFGQRHGQNIELFNRTGEAFDSRLGGHESLKARLFAGAKLYFHGEVGVPECCDWIVAAAERVGDVAIIDTARGLRRYLIGRPKLNERFELRAWG